MLTHAKLEQMQNVDVGAVDKGSLSDVSRIKLDTSLPKDKRMARILRAAKNPYCFRYGDMAVKVEFSNNAPPLQDTRMIGDPPGAQIILFVLFVL